MIIKDDFDEGGGGWKFIFGGELQMDILFGVWVEVILSFKGGVKFKNRSIKLFRVNCDVKEGMTNVSIVLVDS
jgi:hypothetical protein